MMLASLFAVVSTALIAGALPPPGLAVSVEPQQPQLGARIHYQLRLTHPKAHRYELAEVEKLESVPVMDHQRSRVDGADQAITTFDFTLASLDLGKQALPDLTFTVSTPEGASQWTADGPAFEVAPTTASAEDAKLRDIADPHAYRVPNYGLLWLSLVVVAAAALGFAFWARRRRRVKPALPLDERTRVALQQLAAERLPDRGAFREFHFRLSEIIRGYLAERFQIDARESTTSELISRLGLLEGNQALHQELVQHLRAADRVKFGLGSVKPEACDEALALGQRIVDLTPPPPTRGAHG